MVNYNRYVISFLLTSLLALAILRSSRIHPGEFMIGSPKHFENYFKRFGGQSIAKHKANVSELLTPKANVDKQNEPVVDIGNRTVVLMWTTYYQMPSYKVMKLITSGRAWDPECCAGDDLLVTFDKRLLANATVLVFYNFHGDLDVRKLPKLRRPGQLWVLFGKESPVYSPDLGQFPNVFNWTMTYRRDSDIWSPYGYTIPLEHRIPDSESIAMPGNISLKHWIAKKSKTMAGVISRCNSDSKRETLIAALQNASLPLDIYGACGNRSICSRHNLKCDFENFWLKIGAQYKFYFTAENSFCMDYITEKFWRTLQVGMVPVVYGGADYTAVAPPNSFIDTRDFKTPSEIAEYLINLAGDTVQYSKYFEWRRRYNVRLTEGWHGWCKLCKLARQYRNSSGKMEIDPNKSYKDLKSWWTMEGNGLKETACTHGSPFKI